MCFRDDDSGHDIWLTIENGKYVPAPPMVYMPGLRQIQDRMHTKGYPIRSPVMSGNGVVRLPNAATIPNYPGNHSPTPGLAQPSPENTVPDPPEPAVTDQAADMTEPIADPNPPEVLPTPEPEPEAPAEAPPATPADDSISISTNCADSSTSTSHDASPSPSASASTSSPPHSILKPPSVSASSDTASKTQIESRDESQKDDDPKRKKPKKTKGKKSVSFTDETTTTTTAPSEVSIEPPEAPAPSAPSIEPPTVPRSAAAEGAAIARRLVDKEGEAAGSTDKGLKLKGVGGGEERVADLGRQLVQRRRDGIPGGLGMERDHGKAGGRGTWLGKGEASERGGGSTAGRQEAPLPSAVGQQVARARLGSYQVVNEEDEEGYADDEIPGRWP